MGNPKPSNPKKIKPGEIRNPLGAGAHNKDLKAIRRLTYDDLADLGSMILAGDLMTLEFVMDDARATVLHKWFASIALKAIAKGDVAALSVLLDRIVGKTPDRLQLLNGDGKALSKPFDREAAEERVAAILEKALAKRAIEPMEDDNVEDD